MPSILLENVYFKLNVVMIYFLNFWTEVRERRGMWLMARGMRDDWHWVMQIWRSGMEGTINVTNKASIIQFKLLLTNSKPIRDNLELIWGQNGRRYAFNIETIAFLLLIAAFPFHPWLGIWVVSGDPCDRSHLLFTFAEKYFNIKQH